MAKRKRRKRGILGALLGGKRRRRRNGRIGKR
jgi:hypothetical protein